MMVRYHKCEDTWMSFVEMSISSLNFGYSDLMNYDNKQERWIYVSIFWIASVISTRVRV